MVKREVKPITGTDVEKLFTSRQFCNRLTEAHDICLNTGHETGFGVCRYTKKANFVYGQVVGEDAEDSGPVKTGAGVTDPFGSLVDGYNRSIEAIFPNSRWMHYTTEIFPVLSLHFHPFRHRFEPSLSDLRSFFLIRELFCKNDDENITFNYNPFELICSIPNKERIEILVLQETSKFPQGENHAELLKSSIDNNPEFYDSNKKIAEIYASQSGIQAAMLTYVRSGKLYRLANGEDKKLAAFASNPHFL